jgi:hypothetical protein
MKYFAVALGLTQAQAALTAGHGPQTNDDLAANSSIILPVRCNLMHPLVSILY